MMTVRTPTGDDVPFKGFGEEDREDTPPSPTPVLRSRELTVLRIKHNTAIRNLASLNKEVHETGRIPAINRVQMRSLERLRSTEESIINQITELLPEDINHDFATSDKFRAIHNQAASKLEELMEESKPSSTPVVTSASHHLSIPMPTFDGRYEQWPKFKALFTDIISKSCDSDAVKLHHLSKALTGNAAGIINASVLINNNFKSAWQLLERRFENPRLIVDQHIVGLLKLKPVRQESASALRELVDTCKTHVDGLAHMGKPLDGTSNLIVTHIVTSCLDPESRKEWERTLSHGEFPELHRTLDFINKQCEVLEQCSPELMRQSNRHKQVTKAYISTVTEHHPECAICHNHHSLHKCPELLAMSTTKRMDKVQAMKRCINCLGFGHQVKQCTSKWSCQKCRQRHHTLLHTKGETDNAQSSSRNQLTLSPSSSRSRIVLNADSASSVNVLLSTVMLHVIDQHGDKHVARALLDSGAQSNFMASRLAQALRLNHKLVNIPLTGIGGEIGTNVRQAVRARIGSRQSNYTETMDFLVLPNPSAILPVQRIDIRKWNIPPKCLLADPAFNEPGNIDIILGAEHFFNFLKKRHVKLGKEMPVLQETEFGWIVSGKTSNPGTSKPVMCAVATHASLEELMKGFFAIENLSSVPSWSPEERLCQDHYKNTTTRDDNGRYIVQLPRKQGMIGKLGDSKNTTLRRFLAIERRLHREPETRKAYIEFMEEYQRLGHMSKVAGIDTAVETYYLPHHPVFKAESTTTKCRVVFDASCKTTTGISLNDTLMIGPTIQQDGMSILLRFRMHHVALTADVAKMYRQVWIHPKDRSLQRILWRASPEDPVEEYELNTVTYGTASAPFLAVRSLLQTAEDHKHEYPAAAAHFKDVYVDDFVSGDSSIEMARILQQVAQLYQKGGFCLRKWISSEPVVLQGMDPRNMAAHETGEQLTILGLVWDPSSDTLCFKVNTGSLQGVVTKRKVLSCIARLYDPIGILDPVKTKVAPIGVKHSIARLELCAAHLAALLYERIAKALHLTSPAIFWSDSTTVIHWLRAPPSSWKPFVANRVSQIQQLTEGCTWRHIPGEDNPADLASRGCSALDLLHNSLWWQGPSWIYRSEDKWPQQLSTSDNATNFKGAANQLRELYYLVKSPEHQKSVQSWTMDQGIIWKFIPPRAPHFGGLWEAAVRSMKHHLQRVLGTSTLSFEDMATLLAEIECCLNSRPIVPLTDDPSDATALTPGHFLTGSHLLQVPNIESTQLPANRLNHWRHVQQLMRRFWDANIYNSYKYAQNGERIQIRSLPQGHW